MYRHSDGYPGNVLRDLADPKNLLDATRAERGPAYTAATFVFLDKLSTIDPYLDATLGERSTQRSQQTSSTRPIWSTLINRCS